MQAGNRAGSEPRKGLKWKSMTSRLEPPGERLEVGDWNGKPGPRG